MDANRKIYTEPHDCTRRLADLGLDDKWLQEAVQAGQLQRLSCTAHHPVSYGGYSAWAETIKTLRDLLIPQGWSSENSKGLPLAVSPKRTISITVATGDDATGRAEFEPCTKCPKGPQTKNAVSNNQLSLFSDSEFARAIKNRADKGQITWLLLICCDWQTREVRSELSLPVGMNEEGRVDGWDERIIFGSTPFDADELEIPTDDIPQSPNIIVNVKRRA